MASGVLNVKYYLPACEVVRNKILKKENHIFFSQKKKVGGKNLFRVPKRKEICFLTITLPEMLVGFYFLITCSLSKMKWDIEFLLRPARTEF